MMVIVYLLYDGARGLAAGGSSTAVRHARQIYVLEAHLHLDPEHVVQRFWMHVPGATAVFGFGYATFHLGVTGAVLLWLFYRRPDRYPEMRNAVIGATILALVGFVMFPTAPPRSAGIGMTDTLHLGRETAHSGALRFLYNPYAAMPSVHMAFATVAGVTIALYATRRVIRVLGVLYPIYTAIEVIATGNHFMADIVVGTLTGITAMAIATVSARPGSRAVTDDMDALLRLDGLGCRRDQDLHRQGSRSASGRGAEP